MADSGFFGQRPGFHFAPTPSQILAYYLPTKISGDFPHDAAIPTVDVFSVVAPPPWLLHPAAAAAATSSHCCASPTYLTDWFYCFAWVTPRGPGFCRETGVGTWLANGRDKKIEGGGRILGHMTALSFRVSDGSPKGRNTGWVLNEFRLHREKVAPKAETLVFCRIRCSRPHVWKEAMGMMGRVEEEEHPHRPCKRQRSDPNFVSGAAAIPGALPLILPAAGGEYGYNAMQLLLLEEMLEITTTATAPDSSRNPEGEGSSCSVTEITGLPCPSAVVGLQPAASNEDDIWEGINAEDLDYLGGESCCLGGEREQYSYRGCPTESSVLPCASSADDPEVEDVWRLVRELEASIDDIPLPEF